MKVYLVEDIKNSVGKVYCVMADFEDANDIADSIEARLNTECNVVERTLFYGQPPVEGYNS